MRRWLGLRHDSHPGEITCDDWTPIPPAHQAGQIDLARWLQESQPAVPPRPPDPRPSWIEVLKSFGEHLTDAELQIIRQQLAR
jgi:hypothetical protein